MSAPVPAPAVATAVPAAACPPLVGGDVLTPTALYDLTAEDLVRRGFSRVKPFSLQGLSEVLNCWRMHLVSRTSPPPPPPPPPSPPPSPSPSPASSPRPITAISFTSTARWRHHDAAQPSAQSSSTQPAQQGASCSIRLRAEVRSTATCVLGKSYGCYPGVSTMWVSLGCRGTFSCNGARTGICGFKRPLPQLSSTQLTNCSCAEDSDERDAINAKWWAEQQQKAPVANHTAVVAHRRSGLVGGAAGAAHGGLTTRGAGPSSTQSSTTDRTAPAAAQAMGRRGLRKLLRQAEGARGGGPRPRNTASASTSTPSTRGAGTSARGTAPATTHDTAITTPYGYGG
jgi:hypothetical protein